MQKGVDIVRLMIIPEAVREPRKGERFTPTVTVGVARTVRDGLDVFQSGNTGEAQAGRNPRIAELGRELLALVAQEIANTGSDVVFVGSVAGAFASFHPNGPALVSEVRDESRDNVLVETGAPSITDALELPALTEPPAPLFRSEPAPDEPPPPPLFGSGADTPPPG